MDWWVYRGRAVRPGRGGGLLAALVPHLKSRSLVDVGAERESFAQAMLDGGIERVYAFEPEPENVTELRSRLADDPRVVVESYALSDQNRQRELRRSRDPSGARITFGEPSLSGRTRLRSPGVSRSRWRRAPSDRFFAPA
jgi:hypothetical protein